jgi:hypothetical protein
MGKRWETCQVARRWRIGEPRSTGPGRGRETQAGMPHPVRYRDAVQTRTRTCMLLYCTRDSCVGRGCCADQFDRGACYCRDVRDVAMMTPPPPSAGIWIISTAGRPDSVPRTTRPGPTARFLESTTTCTSTTTRPPQVSTAQSACTTLKKRKRELLLWICCTTHFAVSFMHAALLGCDEHPSIGSRRPFFYRSRRFRSRYGSSAPHRFCCGRAARPTCPPTCPVAAEPVPSRERAPPARPDPRTRSAARGSCQCCLASPPSASGLSLSRAPPSPDPAGPAITQHQHSRFPFPSSAGAPPPRPEPSRAHHHHRPGETPSLSHATAPSGAASRSCGRARPPRRRRG